jgi:DNA-binding transcriptional LysR family regulator
MELRHLEQISAICRSGSFSSAARSLNISQPTLSKSITRLEKRLGVLLFDRSGGAAKPTAYGSYVAQEAEKLLHSVETLSRELEKRAQGESGRLVIAVGPASRIRPLPHVMRRIGEMYPNLRIVTRQIQGALVVRGVADGDYDIAFSNRENAEAHGDLIRIKLYDSPVVCAVRPGHPLTRCESPTPEIMASYPHATFRVGHEYRRWLGEAGRINANRLDAIVSDDLSIILQHALETGAVIRVPRFTIKSEVAEGRLVELPIPELNTFECWMLTTQGLWKSAIVQRIAEFAREADVVLPQSSPDHAS